MAACPSRAVQQKILEDPLAHLPCSPTVIVRKGQTIDGLIEPAQSIFLVIEGKVLVYLLARNGRRFLADIYGPDDFFGLSSLVGTRSFQEEAIAMETAKIMAWTVADIQKLETERPKLGLALVQMLAQRSVEYGRILARGRLDWMDSRLARALLRFGDRFGVQNEHGWIRLPPMSHQMLSEHIGTSREIVTHFMTDFRNQQLLRYTRKEMVIDAEALRHWLQGRSTA